MCKSYQVVLVLKAWRCHVEELRPWEAIGECASSVVVDGPGLKGSCKGVEAWHHEESLWEASVEAKLQWKTAAFWRCQYHEMTTKNSSTSGVQASGAYRMTHVLQRAWLEKWLKPLEEPRRSWVGSQTLDGWRLIFAFDCDCALIFFPLEGRFLVKRAV